MRAFFPGPLIAAILVLPAVSATRLAAQVPFIPVESGRSVGVEVIRPSYADGFEGVGGLTGQLHLSALMPLSPGVRLVAELPLAHFDPAFDGFDGATSRIGNPFLGVRIGDPARTAGRFGVRLPLASDADMGDAAPLELAAFADYDRIEAYLPRVMTVGGAAQFGRTAPSGLMGRAVLGADLMVSTRGGDPEVFAAYGIETGYERQGTAAVAALTGRALVSESGLSIAERTIHQVTLSGSHRFGGVQPTLWVRMPLDSGLDELLDYAVGLSMRVGI